jgi:hypothetical protein
LIPGPRYGIFNNYIHISRAKNSATFPEENCNLLFFLGRIEQYAKQKPFKSVNFEEENHKKPRLGAIHGWNKLVLASANYVSGPLGFQVRSG